MANKINKITKNGVAYDIEDPNAATAAQLEAEKTARQNADGDLQNAINGKQAALSTAQLDAVNSGINSTKVGQIATNTTNIGTNTGDIATINGKIPAQASSSNQLADKSFVNSTVQTASANFRGNWGTWDDVPTDANDYPADADGNKTPTKNDYMVVQDASGFPTSPDPALAGTWRFKYSGIWATDGKNGWHPEYQVNETPLTSDQLAALNSGITAEAVAKLGGIEAGAEVNDINSISVNGTAVTPDANKNVALTISEGIKTLTMADYNYPTTNPDGVALWKIAPGIYKVPYGVKTYLSSSGGTITQRQDMAVFVMVSDDKSGYREIICTSSGDNTFGYRLFQVFLNPLNGTIVSIANIGQSDYAILNTKDVEDSLTSSSAKKPLSANKGKYLNDNKADKTAFTGTDGTSAGAMGLVPAPATTDAGKFLKADGTWDSAGSSVNIVQTTGTSTTDVMSQNAVTEALASAGGIKTLTTADYNYPTTGTKTGIALWLLDAGTYITGETVAIYYSVAEAKNVTSGYSFIIGKNPAGQTSIMATEPTGSTGVHYSVVSGTGANLGIYTFANSRILVEKDIANSTTSSSTTIPLAANQGKVLKDLIDSLVIKNAGAPTTSTTGTKGQLLEDTTNGNLYICTNSASPYAWKQIDKDEILTNAGAPTTSTAGTLGQLLTDTTNAKLYQLTAIDTTDPNAPVYTWTEVGGSSGPTVVQTTGTSTANVMSQNAVTGMVYADPSTKRKVRIGTTYTGGDDSVAIGVSANTNGAAGGVSIGTLSAAHAKGAVALGMYSFAAHIGEMNIGSTDTSYGYNSSNYRLLSGVYDGQSAHDAATKGQLDNAIINGGTTAPTNSTAGAVGTQYTYVDTTGTPTAHLCVCTEIDNTDPSSPVYTWSTLI